MGASDGSAATIERVVLSAYTIPTDAPEADGTYAWAETVLVLAEVTAGGRTGVGYTYADAATAHFAHAHLAPLLVGRDALDVPAAWVAMCRHVRNLGRAGVAAMAISALDAALWDVKAKALGLPLFRLLGAARDAAPLYGSGGFTSYAPERLQKQLAGWAGQGISRVKMKVGTHPERDVWRVEAAREAIGERVELFVDANGAYSRKQALAFSEEFAALGVTWFEEPVSSDDLAGLRLLRDRGPVGVDVAAGEYGYDPAYFRRMLEAGAVDALQADASRCGGITGFLKAADLCEAFGLPFSAHCAPALHLHPACACTADFRHLEYFHDHVRIEAMLFDGTAAPVNGALRPDPSRSGLGLAFKHADAQRFKSWAASN
ncbi:enolase C-terminal domain-like protein [Frigoriglobus tundricola]|uniref:Mandelate racemase/muconate lactonizing enzyme:Mandelate racemase/muconate lactonizing enzyme n=1 Tax=Frigoriglobus tundricola TaxID=2774151 RepID=A0A6M5YIT9_9BACT|nr:enolase C-terminal domain-like protein [Frigoriglobus tundricola]QJW93163.1 Mandelate racemase/muconate lactonizing enzyme:Mandelate racemase/muconate lactonizing enzyme [Frigoriglobus tundricola]